jgi:ABC-type glycerol-3-phosphate transport system permease component
MNLIDSLWVYILPAIPSSMGVFLMKQYMDSGIPEALLESARIDGANTWAMYFKIAMPLSKPAWMTLFLFAFQGIWSVSPTNGTIFSEQLKTLPSVMSSIAAGGMARAGSAMATTVIMMIPPIIVYFISQSNVMETMSTSGIKE